MVCVVRHEVGVRERAERSPASRSAGLPTAPALLCPMDGIVSAPTCRVPQNEPGGQKQMSERDLHVQYIHAIVLGPTTCN